MSEATVCKFLEWDSDFFGLRIGRVTASSLDSGTIDRVCAWAAQERIDCLYFLCPLADKASIHVAEHAGFFLTDIRVTFEAVLGGSARPDLNVTPRVRSQRPEDIAALKTLAGASHQQTRFFADPHFSRLLCGKLYEIWMEKSCASNTSHVLVAATPGGAVQGYITCDLHEDTPGSIGLVGVDAGARKMGLGRELVLASLHYFETRGCTRATVVTQGQNIEAQRLYQSCGFVIQSVEAWHHCWLGKKPAFFNK